MPRGFRSSSSSSAADSPSYSRALWSSLGFLAALVVALRLAQLGYRHLRLLMTVDATDSQQRIWTQVGSVWPWIKTHMIYAPVYKVRHNKEIQLSKAISVGTLPLRLDILILIFYLLSNIAYTLVIGFDGRSQASLVAETRGRTGHLAVINMMILFIFAARNNPLIPILGLSFDTFNLFHRWIGRIIIFESLAHVSCWLINEIDARGVEGIRDGFATDPFIQAGLLAIIAMILILIQTPSPIRHAFYEVFLHLHQALAISALIGIYRHAKIQSLPQKLMMNVIVAIWAIERGTRFLRLLYYNISHRGITEAHVEALEGGACRVTFYIPHSWSNKPACHLYAYIPAVSLWMSHPFSIAWVEQGQLQRRASTFVPSSTATTAIGSPESTPRPSISKPPGVSIDTSCDTEFHPLPLMKNKKAAALTCIIASRTGMTGKLYRRAQNAPNGILRLRAFVEGPYGGLDSLRSYATVLLFAGGIGITHQLSHMRDLISAVEAGTCATRKLTLIWSVRHLDQVLWAHPFLEELMDMPRDGIKVKIIVYVSQRGRRDPESRESEKEVKVQDLTVGNLRSGRPKTKDIVEREFEARIGAMTVGVCGPGALADDVRAAARGCVQRGKVDFWEEAFTW